MNFYASGLEAIADMGAQVPRTVANAARAGQEGFGSFVTPGQIDAKARELDAAFQGMHQGVLAFSPPPDRATDWNQWRDAWIAFRASWEGFQNQLRDDTATRLFGSTAEMLLHYQARLAAWQDDFRRTWNARIPGPVVEKPKPQDNTWRTIGIGIVISVGAGVALWALHKVLP